MLRVPSTISKVGTMSDGGIRLQVDTQELTPEDKAEMMNLHNKLGYFVFSENVIQEQDIPNEPIEFMNQKSLSERLRNLLWVLHEKRGGKPEDFEVFRHKYMEAVMAKIKEKISELDQ
jgi:hypothetical protein